MVYLMPVSELMKGTKIKLVLFFTFLFFIFAKAAPEPSHADISDLFKSKIIACNKQMFSHTLLKAEEDKNLIIKGIIKDRVTKTLLPDISVKILNEQNQVVGDFKTDEFGEFKIQIPPGNYKIEIFAEGYFTYVKEIQTSALKRNYFSEAIYVAYLTKDKSYKKNEDKISKKDFPAIINKVDTVNNVTIEKDTIKSKINQPLVEEDLFNMADDKLVELSGTLIDSLSKQRVKSGRISLSGITNESYQKDIETDNEGHFSLKLFPGSYWLDITADRYITVLKGIEINNSTKLGYLYMIPDKQNKKEREIDGVIITGRAPKIAIRGDTLQYDVSKYMKKNGALLQDIIKNIPGMKVDGNGVLTVNGQPVRKITIDGKEFFNNDIQMALKNMPADIITKLEIYKETSDISKITGFRDNNEDQVMNLKIKEEFKNSLFGNAQVGYGSDDRYNHKGMLNYLGKQSQFSIVGNANNTNGDSEEVDSFSEDTGILTYKTIGINGGYEYKSGLKVSGNIRYTDNLNTLKTMDNTEYFLSNEKRNSISESSEKNEAQNTAFDVNLSMEPKSKFSMYFRLSGEHEDNTKKSYSEAFSFSDLSKPTQEIFDGSTENKTNLIKGSLTLGWKLNEKGRAISLSLNGNYNKEEGNGYQKFRTIYENNNTEVDLDQKSTLKDKNTNLAFSLSYTEPFNANNSLLLSYSFQKSDNNKENMVLNKNDDGMYMDIDSTYTRFNTVSLKNHIMNVQYQSIYEKYQYSLGVTAEPTDSRKKINIGDHLIQTVNQNVLNYSGHARFQYKPSRNKIFTFNYSGLVIKPNVDQLTSDTTTISPTNRSFGNPDLKSTLNNNFSFQFQKTSLKTGRFFSAMLNLNYVVDQVASYTMIDALGNTASTYRNVNGNWGANLGSTFNTPIKEGVLSMDWNINTSYYHYLGFMNDVKNSTDNYRLNTFAALNLDADFLESRLQFSYNYNITQNDQSGQSDLEASSWGVNNLTRVDLPFNIEWYNYLGYTYYSGYNSDINKNEYIWNITLSKKILKKKKGELRLQFYDILNSRNNIMRTINSNYISDVRVNVLKRYFMFSFIYRFNSAK